MTSLVTLVLVRTVLHKSCKFGLPYFHEFYSGFFWKLLHDKLNSDGSLYFCKKPTKNR